MKSIAIFKLQRVNPLVTRWLQYKEAVSRVLYHSLFGTPTTKAVGFHFVTYLEPTALVVGVLSQNKPVSEKWTFDTASGLQNVTVEGLQNVTLRSSGKNDFMTLNQLPSLLTNLMIT
jgi:hypothetical protein